MFRKTLEAIFHQKPDGSLDTENEAGSYGLLEMQILSSVSSDLGIEGHEPFSGRYRDDLHVQ